VFHVKRVLVFGLFFGWCFGWSTAALWRVVLHFALSHGCCGFRVSRVVLGFVPLLACISDILLGVAASEQILIRISPRELEAIEGARGEVPRSTWIKERCRDAIVAQRSGVVQLPPRGGEVVAMAPAEGLEPGGERARSLGLTGDGSRRPAGGMVGQPRPIVQKRGKR
jgi:hypothetical protein